MRSGAVAVRLGDSVRWLKGRCRPLGGPRREQGFRPARSVRPSQIGCVEVIGQVRSCSKMRPLSRVSGLAMMKASRSGIRGRGWWVIGVSSATGIARRSMMNDSPSTTSRTISLVFTRSSGAEEDGMWRSIAQGRGTVDFSRRERCGVPQERGLPGLKPCAGHVAGNSEALVQLGEAARDLCVDGVLLLMEEFLFQGEDVESTVNILLRGRAGTGDDGVVYQLLVPWGDGDGHGVGGQWDASLG